MEEYAAEAFANRDEPVPVLSASISNGDNGDSLRAGGEDGTKKGVFRQFKETLSDERGDKGDHGSRRSLQDRLLAK